MTFKDFLKKFSFEKRGPDTSHRWRGCPPPDISQADIDILKRMSERKNMGIDYKKLAEQDLDRLKRIIENKNEPTRLKIDRIILWQREKRASELHNILRRHFTDLHRTISTRSESAWRGVEFMRDKIDRDTQHQQKETTMKTLITLEIVGNTSLGKSTFIENLQPLLEAAARVTLKGPYDILTNEVTLLNEEEEKIYKEEHPEKRSLKERVAQTARMERRAERKAEMLMSLERMEQLENDRYAARTRMNQLLRELGQCPREVDALVNENEAENHNVMSFIVKLRKDVEEGNV